MSTLFTKVLIFTGFGISKDEEIMKGPLTFNFGNTSLFKEDSKEDSARETLNLVEKLRMELSKKSTSCDVDDGASVSSSTKNENDRTEFAEQVVPNSNIGAESKTEPKLEEVATVNLEMRVEVTDTTPSRTKSFDDRGQQPDYRYMSCEADVPLEQDNKNIPIEQHHGLVDHGISGQGDERWVPPSNEGYNNVQTIGNANWWFGVVEALYVVVLPLTLFALVWFSYKGLHFLRYVECFNKFYCFKFNHEMLL